ncbi:hypothetical protein ACFPT7_04290 [Acidicapsa dinghuensis]|uniref:Uncharacterized protein n=1 Tax=Acidicapsa dinghuensis TaxID=2218256 RepID=A0ABW1EBV4_9BACT|nr:hypothetical protein [Acidicapsa dinghuensis]
MTRRELAGAIVSAAGGDATEFHYYLSRYGIVRPATEDRDYE